jgi:tetratricopeptide (TPR) repeat protein
MICLKAMIAKPALLGGLFYNRHMTMTHRLLLLCSSLFLVAPVIAQERLGTVDFPISCSPSVAPAFNRGVALLHDFWYEEARRQFEQIAKTDPLCAMAHWGAAMSVFHEIWDRPDESAVAFGKKQMHIAASHPAKTVRETGYINALKDFFDSAGRDYSASITAYAAAMQKLYASNPQDIDAGAFYALSVLAAESPTDTSLTAEHRAMAVLVPLFNQHPDHPGLVHYIIHACDTPSLAADGLVAARHYGEIAATAPHAVHMPGHIFSRLGLWQEDIDANELSVKASHAAEQRQQSGSMDQFHSDDFLLYAYLQTANDERVHAVLQDSAAALEHFESMPDMTDHFMAGMLPYYRTKFPVFYALEMRDWPATARISPIAGAPPETQTLTYWARSIAAGHLRQPQQARADLADYDLLMDRLKKGRHAYYAESTGGRIQREEMQAWIAFAESDAGTAVTHMRAAADLQDKVGQGEVDIPAREMLADMLLELNRPQEALSEYQLSLKLSPNRFNGLFNAGRAAEAAGDLPGAKHYYAALLAITADGAHSSRPELTHAKSLQ